MGAATTEETGRLVAGTRIADGRYELVRPLGDGAMGVVWEGVHLALGRRVAIKLLRPEMMQRPLSGERFEREARAASSLRHRNAVQILDFGRADGHHYLVMEHLEGQVLSDVLYEQGRLGPERAIRAAVQICAALAAAHDQRIVHRDMKPSNIMLVPWTDDDGRATELVKVLDFGIAKILADDQSHSVDLGLTLEGDVCGTPAYMSPEQAEARPLDSRSDIYSTGIVLYEMLVGDVPHIADTPLGIMIKQVSEQPVAPRERDPTIPEALERIVLRCLAKAPDDRYADARSLRAALIEALPAGSPAIPVTEPPGGPPVSSRVESAASGAATVAAIPGAPRRRHLWWIAPLLVAGAALVAWQLLDTPEPGAPVAARDSGAPAFDDSRTAPEPALSDPQPGPATSPEPDAGSAAVAVAVDAATTPAPDSAAADASIKEHVTEQDAKEHVTEQDATTAEVTGEQDTATAEVTPAPEVVVERQLAAVEPASRPRKKRPVRVAARPTVEPDSVSDERPETDKAPASEPAALPTPEPEVAQPPEAIPEPDPEPEVIPDPEPEVILEPEPEPSLQASVSLAGLSVDGSLSKRSVKQALARAVGALEACYRTAAQAAGRDHAGPLSVSLVIDVDGQARDVEVGAFGLSGVGDCARAALRRVRTRDRPDTGTVAASFTVRFTPEEP